MAGYEYDELQTVAKLWKNGEAQYLSDATGYYSMVYSVFVSGSDVYVAGRDQTWKNGEEIFDNGGRSIFVSGNDVFVAGYVDPSYSGHARLWKNGVEQNMEGTEKESMANSVFVVE